MDASHRVSLALPALLAGVVAAVLLQGGYYVSQAAIVAAVLVAGIVVSWSLVLPRAVLLGFAVLGTALLVSTVANGWTSAAAKPFLTLLIAAACAELAARAIVADGRAAVIEIVVLVGAGVALAGIAGVAWHIEPLAARADPWRLQSTLTYQNAAGSMLVLALAPAALLAGRGAPVTRAAFAVILAGLGATLSRGAFVAALVAVAVVAIGARPRVAPLVRPAAGAALALAGLVPAMLDWRGSAVIAPIGVLFGIWLASTGRSMRIPPRVAFAAVGVVIVAAIAVVPTTALRGRLTLSSTDRARVWTETWRRLDRDLLTGTGPGTYRLIARRDRLIVRTEHAHNEYLQTLSETGIVGLAGVVAALALFVRASLAATARIPRDTWVAAVASAAAFTAHSALDFLWRIPALVAVAFVLLACATVEEPAGTKRTDRNEGFGR